MTHEALLQQALKFIESAHEGEWGGNIDREALVEKLRGALANCSGILNSSGAALEAPEVKAETCPRCYAAQFDIGNRPVQPTNAPLPERLALRAARMARVLEANETVPTLREIAQGTNEARSSEPAVAPSADTLHHLPPNTELLTWFPASSPPDADSTVVIELDPASDYSEPVFLGYWSGSEWLDVHNEPVPVLRWANMPTGGK